MTASISVIAPMLNEAAHVENLVHDLAAQDFDGRVEVLVADGGSSDGCEALLVAAARKANLDLTVLENPGRRVSPGLNACIRRGRGALFVRMDCHTRYPTDYLRRCFTAVAETGAWNVGGLLRTSGRTRTERAVACAMDSLFGGIDWTRHGSTTDRVDVDTVPFGAFPAEVFERIGLFDETLVRNQDDEFNLRIRRAGGRVVLDPALSTAYVPRGSLRGVFSQYYQYGLWKIPVLRKHRRIGARSLVPAAFVLSLTGLACGGVLLPAARRLLVAEAGAYAILAVAFAVREVRRRQEDAALVPFVAAAFPAFHLGYGAGMLRGWLEHLRARTR
jgi:glycosyltransferase involved in cell wall biosynthesis